MVRRIAAFLVTLVIGVIAGIVDIYIVIMGAAGEGEESLFFLALLQSLYFVLVCMLTCLFVQVIKQPNAKKTFALLVGLFSGISFFVFLLKIWPGFPFLVTLGVDLFNLGVYYVVGIITQAIITLKPASPTLITPVQGDKG